MSDRDPIDIAAPWTIKSVPTGCRTAITEAARKEGLTVGQWLDKRVAEWLADGSPVHVSVSGPGNAVQAAAVLEMLANMGRAGIATQKGVGALANRLVKRELRHVLARTDRPLLVRQIPAPPEASDAP